MFPKDMAKKSCRITKLFYSDLHQTCYNAECLNNDVEQHKSKHNLCKTEFNQADYTMV